MGNKVSTATLLIVLLLAFTIYGLDLFDPVIPKDILGETLKTLKEFRAKKNNERDAKKKAKEKAKKEAECIAKVKSTSTLYSYLLGDDDINMNTCIEGEDEWSCDCRTFDCFDDSPVDCECEMALEEAQMRVKELELKLLTNGIDIY